MRPDPPPAGQLPTRPCVVVDREAPPADLDPLLRLLAVLARANAAAQAPAGRRREGGQPA
jgi:hypothetical protein